MANQQQEWDKVWWEKQKNGGWINLTSPLAQNTAVCSYFNNFIKKFYWQFRQEKGIPRGSYNPEINFRGFKEFIISQNALGKCLLNLNTEFEGTGQGQPKIYYAAISIVINQSYLLNKLGMERFITSSPSPGQKYYFREIHFDKLMKTMAHELAHAYQHTINLKKEGETSSCESSGEKDASGNFLYPQLVAEHTQLTAEIKQMITASTKYQEFKNWWTNQSPSLEIPVENEPEEEGQKCKNCANEDTSGFDYCPHCQRERRELEKLISLLKGSRDLASLEKNYQTAKENFLYSRNKNTLDGNENNKQLLDNCYTQRIINLKLQSSNTNNSFDFSGSLWIFILALWGIALLAVGLLIIPRRRRTKN